MVKYKFKKNLFFLFKFSIDILKNICILLNSSIIKMKKKLNIDSSVINIFNKKFLTYVTQIVLMEKFNNFEINKISWTSKKEFDTKINSMKAKALRFISSILINLKKIEISNEQKEEFIKLISYGIELLDNVILNKFDYLNVMSSNSLENPDYSYEEYLTNYLAFFEKILITEPFSSIYLSFTFK